MIVLFHAGAEGADRAHVPHGHEHAFGEDRGDLRAFARTAIDAGADVVLGSGPHVLRGLELYRGPPDRLLARQPHGLAQLQHERRGALAERPGTVDLSRTGRFVRGEIDSLRLDRIGVPHRDPASARPA